MRPDHARRWMASFVIGLTACVMCLAWSSQALAQSVCIPLPRLLTISPMGGKIGSTETEVVLTGDHIEDASELLFDQPFIKARPKRDAQGNIEPGKYVVSIAADAQPGLVQARVMTRLGISSARVFSIDTLDEVSRATANTSLAEAMELKLNSICNAHTSTKSIDHYRFAAKKDQRVLIHCASRSIDSKLDSVLVVGDAAGRDLVVERRGGAIDFTVPEDGNYTIKIHDLTYNGGPAYFYRLSLRELSRDSALPKFPATQAVSAFSWPPANMNALAANTGSASEQEPNNDHRTAQKIELPCDISGAFFPAADVDTFEFVGKKGETWWIEVASERLGRPTDPAIVVSQAAASDANTFNDLLELSDIASPVKVSSNGYAYDGPPFNAGSTDILGKLEIKEDGVHHLQLSDLFGGTRNDARNIYRLIIRRATPDFALVAWGLHMELRNGDRAALSKPIALRAGQTVALEVVALRRDGFDGAIELSMSNLPPGVTAQGLTIPSGKSRGIMLVTANQDAQASFAHATFEGTAKIGEPAEPTKRSVRMAEMAWPVPDSWGEIPVPRLVTDVPVSIVAAEAAPLSIRPRTGETLQVTAGQKLTVPLSIVRRCEFSGASMQLKTFGDGFERAPAQSIKITEDQAEVTLDTAALKTPPGDYVIAFYGGAVAKYQDNPGAVAIATALQQKADEAVKNAQMEVDRVNAAISTADTPEKEAAGTSRLGRSQGKSRASSHTSQSGCR